MQVREFRRDDEGDNLMRRRIERELCNLANHGNRYWRESRLYDCHEFGFCLFVRSTGGWLPQWFQPVQPVKFNKPRIVTAITSTDQDAGLRERWQFALSKLGYLYCVAWERYGKNKGKWALLDWYRAWAKPRHRYTAFPSSAVPEDWVFREAERRLSLKRKR